MVVIIEDFSINHFMQAVVVGGADRLAGTVELMDANDGTKIAAYKVNKSVAENGWLGALINAAEMTRSD